MALAEDMAGAAAIAVTALAVAGGLPRGANYERLVSFGKAQFDSYDSMGVGNPSLGPFEALGRSFAADSVLKTTFASINGRGTAEAFVDKAYVKVFGAHPTEAAKAALVAQVSYFEGLYLGAGIGAADANLQAKGAVFGQIIGYAFADSTGAALSGLDDVVWPLVAQGNAGNFSEFKGLPRYPDTARAQAESKQALMASADSGASGDESAPSAGLLVQLAGMPDQPAAAYLSFA